MGERLAHVDMVRGLAVLWMIFVQLIDMYCFLGLYGGELYGMIKYVNWASMFFIIVGFSVKLMLEKYGMSSFVRKNILRGLMFVIIGAFLIWWCEFNVSSIFGEVVASIGINLIFLTFLVSVFYKSGRYAFIFFYVLAGVMLFFDLFFKLNEHLNPFWLLSFMFLGYSLASLRDNKGELITFLSFGLAFPVVVTNSDHLSRNLSFWISTSFFTMLMLFLMKYLQKIDTIRQLFGYFGRHALFFYFFHYFIFKKLLLMTGLEAGFPLVESVFLSLCSILLLIAFEKFRRTKVMSRISSSLRMRIMTLTSRISMPTEEDLVGKVGENEQGSL